MGLMAVHNRRSGFTIVEVVIVITLVGVSGAIGWSALGEWRDATALRASARKVAGHLALARRLAISRREIVRVAASDVEVALVSPDGERLSSLMLDGIDGLPVDSLRVRPRTLRFNSRGQAAPGSVVVYRGRRSIRIVTNFLGRLRIERVRVVP